MSPNKENLTSLYRYLQNDVITVKARLEPVSKTTRNLDVTMRPAGRSNYNAVVRPIRRL
jgi:hypothetical protein